MLSRHLWLQRPVALQPMVGGLDKKKKKIGYNCKLWAKTLNPRLTARLNRYRATNVVLNLHQYFDLDLEIYRLKLDGSRQAAGIFRTNWE